MSPNTTRIPVSDQTAKALSTALQIGSDVDGREQRLAEPLAQTIHSLAGIYDIYVPSTRIIISGGRPLGSAEKFQEVNLPVDDKLRVAAGVRRATVDTGCPPNDWQVGQTGKVVAAPGLEAPKPRSIPQQHVIEAQDARECIGRIQ